IAVGVPWARCECAVKVIGQRCGAVTPVPAVLPPPLPGHLEQVRPWPFVVAYLLPAPRDRLQRVLDRLVEVGHRAVQAAQGLPHARPVGAVEFLELPQALPGGPTARRGW